jgi:hypothetical protein
MNIICLDRDTLDVDKTKQNLTMWLNHSGSYSSSERHYNLIDPRIVCEQFIDDGSHKFPTDYKFICVGGKAVCILGCTDRESGHAHYSPYDLEWNPLPQYNKSGTIDLIDKPENLEELIATAETLANGIDLVRVDLYSNGRQIWFGEMTLTPAGLIFHSWSQLALDEMGSKIVNLV